MSEYTNLEKSLGFSGNLTSDLQIAADLSDLLLSKYVSTGNKYITNLIINDDYFLHKLSKQYPNSVKYVTSSMSYRQFYNMITNSLNDNSLPFVKKYYQVIKWMIEVGLMTPQECADNMVAYGDVEGLNWVKALSPSLPNYPSSHGAIVGFLRKDPSITEWLMNTNVYNINKSNKRSFDNLEVSSVKEEKITNNSKYLETQCWWNC